ncbi:MAG: AMP-binding protein, partial [Eubacterium sp.]|nr:AMP-binding protein [Eubacterium sp.]
YYAAHEQTAKSFVQNPLNNNYPELIYRTGDLAVYNEDGELVFSGRKDFQIKYMGHRIELEEIEHAMAAIDGVERCVCVFDEQKSKLKGFYIGSIEKTELLSIMRSTLPVFMIPGMIRQIEEMPLTKNGKVDRKKLQEMGRR